MGTIQKINRSRSGSGRVKGLYIPAKRPEVILNCIYTVVIGWLDYRTGIYKWKRELSYVTREMAEQTYNKYFDNMWIKQQGHAPFNSVILVKRFRRE